MMTRNPAASADNYMVAPALRRIRSDVHFPMPTELDERLVES
jgi:hypothetical protein